MGRGSIARVLLRLVVLTAALAALLAAVGYRIADLDAGNTANQGGSVLTPGETELVRADRPDGTEVVVEVCSAALATPASFEGVRFALVDRTNGRTVLERAIDPATIRPGRLYSCARLAHAGAGHGATHLALVAKADRRVDAIVAGRIVTRRPLAAIDFVLIAALAFLAVALLVAIVRPSSDDPNPTESSAPARSPAATVGIVIVILAASFALTLALPIGGTRGGLVRGAMLLAGQLAAVGFALDRDARATFGFVRPANLALVLGLAPALAIAVRLAASVGSHLLPKAAPSAVARLASPSAGLVHAETILDSRSGILAIAAVAVVAPIVEELFFRGVLYGSLLRMSRPRIAFAATALAFVLAHVPQTLGDPAALVSIATLSLVATALRARFGSVVAPAAMHLVHNGVLMAIGLAASR